MFRPDALNFFIASAAVSPSFLLFVSEKTSASEIKCQFICICSFYQKLAHLAIPCFLFFFNFLWLLPLSEKRTKSPEAGLNRRPRLYQRRALPTELSGRNYAAIYIVLIYFFLLSQTTNNVLAIKIEE